MNLKKDMLPTEINRYINIIELSGKSLLETINSILDLAKIESGKFSISEENVDLGNLIQSIFTINQVKANEKNLQYHYTISPILPKYIRCDREKIHQIVMNLVSNAVKYTPEGKAVSIEVKLHRQELLIEVLDEGVGIPKEKQKIIFDVFEQVDNTLSRQYEGTGLGLALVKKLSHLLGGTVFLESVLGKGSKFSVRLPLKPSAITNLSIGDGESLSYQFDSSHIILMVEDSPTNQVVSQTLFETIGLALHFANNGKECLEKVKTLNPDLILMDIHMPGMDGIETALQIRALAAFKDTPIVIISADAFSKQRERAYEIGIFDYLTKPLELAELLAVLKKYLPEKSRV